MDPLSIKRKKRSQSCIEKEDLAEKKAQKKTASTTAIMERIAESVMRKLPTDNLLSIVVNSNHCRTSRNDDLERLTAQPQDDASIENSSLIKIDPLLSINLKKFSISEEEYINAKKGLPILDDSSLKKIADIERITFLQKKGFSDMQVARLLQHNNFKSTILESVANHIDKLHQENFSNDQILAIASNVYGQRNVEAVALHCRDAKNFGLSNDDIVQKAACRGGNKKLAVFVKENLAKEITLVYKKSVFVRSQFSK